jgi:hypothetical protein
VPQELQWLIRKAKSPGMTNQSYSVEIRDTLVKTMREAVLRGAIIQYQNYPRRNVLILNAFDYDLCKKDVSGHA